MRTASVTTSGSTHRIHSSCRGSEMHTSLVELLKHALLDLKASWVMWILLALSAVDLVIIVERALFLRSVREDVPRLANELDGLLREGKVREALEKMKASRSAESAV